MAGKSGRVISADPQNAIRQTLLSWEGFLVILVIIINLFCGFLSPNYSLKNVLREMPKYLTEIYILLPMVLVLIMGEIDISVGAIVCLSATAACLVSNGGYSLFLVILAAMTTGVMCGLVNGLVLTKFQELPAMIVTLSTQIIFRGVAEIVLGNGGSISLINSISFRILAGKVGDVPYILIITLIMAALLTFVLARSNFGRKLYAIGSNRETAKYSGINVQGIRLIVYTSVGVMAGICAVFLISVLYGANTTTGNGFEMDVIAMAVFGGVSTNGGKGKMAGALISAFTIICLRIGLGLVNMNSQLILVILGILLIVAVLVPNIVARISMSMERRKV